MVARAEAASAVGSRAQAILVAQVTPVARAGVALAGGNQARVGPAEVALAGGNPARVAPAQATPVALGEVALAAGNLARVVRAEAASAGGSRAAAHREVTAAGVAAARLLAWLSY